MAIVQCPSCRAKLHAGPSSRVRCPKCKAVFDPQAEGVPDAVVIAEDARQAGGAAALTWAILSLVLFPPFGFIAMHEARRVLRADPHNGAARAAKIVASITTTVCLVGLAILIAFIAVRVMVR